MSANTLSASPLKKRSVRKKVAANEPDAGSTTITGSTLESKSATATSEGFTSLLEKITRAQAEFELLQKEQQEHQQQFLSQKHHDETQRKREQETYEYETSLARKKDRDEFEMKKLQWERELNEQKDLLKKDKQELKNLRKQVAGFDSEKDKVVKTALSDLEKRLSQEFATEKKLQDQEIKGEKDLLNLKIQSLSLENTRQSKEIDTLKTSLTELSRQFKETAVKVIEGRTPPVPPPPRTE